MPPMPDWSRGSIFLSNPRYFLKWSGGASVFLSPAGVQLSWGPRPGLSVFASVSKAEKPKSPPALSRLRPAIWRAKSELTTSQRLGPGQCDSKTLVQITGIISRRYSASKIRLETIQFCCSKSVYSTMYSQAVTHPSTNMAQCCLTSVIRRELVFSTWYGRRQRIE